MGTLELSSTPMSDSIQTSSQSLSSSLSLSVMNRSPISKPRDAIWYSRSCSSHSISSVWWLPTLPATAPDINLCLSSSCLLANHIASFSILLASLDCFLLFSSLSTNSVNTLASIPSSDSRLSMILFISDLITASARISFTTMFFMWAVTDIVLVVSTSPSTNSLTILLLAQAHLLVSILLNLSPFSSLSSSSMLLSAPTTPVVEGSVSMSSLGLS